MKSDRPDPRALAAADALAASLRRQDYERYVTAAFAAPGDRWRLFALYGLNLELARIRETVSEPLIGEMRLQFWRDAVAELFEGRARRHDVLDALEGVVAEGRLDRARLEGLIEARAQDLADAPPATLAELEAYAEGTSATLMRLALDCLGVANAPAHQAAEAAGTAYALAGLLRALPHHARAGRLTLPDDLMRRESISARDLAAGRPSPGLARAVGEIAQAARGHLEAARRHRASVPKSALPVLLPLVLADAHLTALERAGHDPFALAPLPNRLAQQVRLAWAASRGRF
jgi:NADH dehydrogenase [ubiquinone] 1 alpha subcomplex assembly factor 6